MKNKNDCFPVDFDPNWPKPKPIDPAKFLAELDGLVKSDAFAPAKSLSEIMGPGVTPSQTPSTGERYLEYVRYRWYHSLWWKIKRILKIKDNIMN
ncbi:hypothetical protein KKA69_05320 [Patescibacteria group bacterium]|nr:hypothetical protein [Patescibacteria group bacterium]